MLHWHVEASYPRAPLRLTAIDCQSTADEWTERLLGRPKAADSITRGLGRFGESPLRHGRTKEQQAHRRDIRGLCEEHSLS